MREIKFRGWHERQKEIYQIQKISFKTKNVLPYGWNIEQPGSDFKLMQYTGLNDKNGREIYEGDIVTLTIYQANSKRVLAYNPKNVAIVWNKKCAKFGWWQNVDQQEDEQWFADFNTYVNLGMEVVGNIHENKDLLLKGCE